MSGEERRVPRVRFRSGWRSSVADAVYSVVQQLLQQGVEGFTVRQLFYQLVVRGVLRSTRQDYKNFDAMLVRLREEDPWLDSLFIDTSKPRYDHYDPRFWRGQRYYLELWLEKEALRGFFEPLARRYRVNLVVCRGYPSITRIREAREQRVPRGARYVILYFGDWDPSGEDIFRWINEELRPYGIEVRKVALTREQVERYNLPSMPANDRDPRYRRYVERYGRYAVELDALHPAVLRDIVRRSILEYMDLHRRLELEIEEGVREEARRIADEVLRDVRRRLVEAAARRIREELNLALPAVYQELLRALERGEELELERLYSRERVMEAVREELSRWAR